MPSQEGSYRGPASASGSDIPAISPTEVLADGAAAISSAVTIDEPTDRIPKRRLIPIFFSTFALFAAFIAPMSYSLAVRIAVLDPAGKDTALPLAIGIPGLLVIVLSPLKGILSDRTRSRFGRRRPWMLGGAIAGLAGSCIVGLSPSVGGVILGWSIAFTAYNLCGSMIIAHFGDRLPEAQRGKVMGINGAITNIAPVAGISVAAAFNTQQVLMLVIPAIVAFVGAIVFLFTAKDPQYTGQLPKFSTKDLVRSFYFNPRKYPEFGWVCLSRAMIFVAVALMSLYTVYLLTTRLGLDAAGAGVLMASLGLPSVGCGVVGAIGSGWLSDKLGTRKPFLLVSGLLLAGGLALVGTTANLPQFVIGSLLSSFAIGIYGAVDQAIALDVMPRENENGRFLAIFGLANAVPQAIGPLVAGLLVSNLGGYGSVYGLGAVFAVFGALVILPVREKLRANRAPVATAGAHAN